MSSLPDRIRRPLASIRPLTLALGTITMTTTAHAEGFSPEERRVSAYVDAHREETVALLERVVNIPSATENHAGVREVGRVFAEELGRIGFETRWVTMPLELKRAGHLVAERRGSKGKRLLLIGHLDTVLEGRRFERDGRKGRGNGALDMKGGDVILLQALKALHSAGALVDRRVIVVMTGDEEDAGIPVETSRAALFEAAARSDIALGFENAIGDTATVARRGASTWWLEVSAKTGHSSGILGPALGAGAIFEAARILEAFRRDLPERHLTLNPSVIAGGTTAEYDEVAKRGTAEGKPNVVPARVVVEGDLRFLSDEQKEATRDKMRAIAARSLPHTEARLTFSDEYPAMSPRPGNDRLLAEYDRASRDLGLGGVQAIDPGRRGAGDISFVPSRLDALDGLGARGEGAHSPDEWIDLDSLPDQIQRAALLIGRLTRE